MLLKVRWIKFNVYIWNYIITQHLMVMPHKFVFFGFWFYNAYFYFFRSKSRAVFIH